MQICTYVVYDECGSEVGEYMASCHAQAQAEAKRIAGVLVARTYEYADEEVVEDHRENQSIPPKEII